MFVMAEHVATLFCSSFLILVMLSQQASEGPPARAENVSVQVTRNGCCYFNAVTTWVVTPAALMDGPDFKIWLTHQNQRVTQKHVIRSEEMKNDSSRYEFKNVLPWSLYMVYIETFKTTENGTNRYAVTNATFTTGRVDLNVEVTADQGYLVASWPVDKTFVDRSVPVVYNISYCPDELNSPPFTCKNVTIAMCGAVYNGTSGHTLDYEWTFRQYAENSNIMGDMPKNRSFVSSSWDSVHRRFRCSTFVNTCSKGITRYMYLMYQIIYDGITQAQYGSKLFKSGYMYEPDYVNITARAATRDANNITVFVRWRFRKLCSVDPAQVNAVWLSNEKGLTTDKRNFHRGQENRVGSLYHNFRWSFIGVDPYSLYTLHVSTDLSTNLGQRTTTTKRFWTPEGAPTASPAIEPIAVSSRDCIDDRRNVTVRWEWPPEEKRNGVIRSVNLQYWNASHEEDKKELTFGNATSAVLSGLHCDIDYAVRVRLCLRLNERCSRYSRPEIIKARESRSDSLGETNLATIILWTCVGVGSALTIAALVVCQCIRRRRMSKKTRLDPVQEGGFDSYSLPDEKEMCEPGEYDRLPMVNENADEA